MPVRLILRRLAIVTLLTPLLVIGVRSPLASAADLADSWSSIGTFRTASGGYATPVHATVLTDGTVLFIGIAHEADPPVPGAPVRRVAWIFDPPAPGQPIPASTTISEITQPVEMDSTPYGKDTLITDDLVCTASVLDDQGRMITAGGTRALLSTKGDGPIVMGIPYLTKYDPDNGTWTRTETMIGNGLYGTPSRWYPTLTRLPDKRLLITGGLEIINLQNPSNVVGVSNSTIESVDPKTGQQMMMANFDQTPEAIHARDYTHVFVLPNAKSAKDLVMIGESGQPVLGNSTQAGSFQTVPAFRPGNGDVNVGYGMSTVQLPIRAKTEWGYTRGSVMTVSGNMNTKFEHLADVFDVGSKTWRSPTIDLGIVRHHPSTVLLPDGRVLIVNGHDMDGGLGVEHAQYIDPRRGFAVTTGAASSGVIRGYHSVAVLLPDGRVLTAGGRDMDTNTSLEKPTYEIYSPAYPSGAKPVLTATPSAVGYGKQLRIASTGPAPKEVVLLGLGAMTHSIDMGQREIQLPIKQTFTSSGGNTLTVATSPADTHVAPPGYYWLVGLSAAGVPSSAKLIKIG